MSLSKIFKLVLTQELRLGLRHLADKLNPMIFFVIVVSLFPLSVIPTAQTLQMLAPGVIWVSALLASLLAMNTMFKTELADGSLEQWLVSEHPTSLLVLAKVLAHWLLTGLPLVIITPLLGLLFYLDGGTISTLMLSIFLGTPSLTFIGAIGASLVVSVRRGGVLLALLVLPLCVPILILGTKAVVEASMGMNVNFHLAFLAAMMLATITFSPWAISSALRVTMH